MQATRTTKWRFKKKLCSYLEFIKIITYFRVYLRCYQVGVIQKPKTFYYNHELAD